MQYNHHSLHNDFKYIYQYRGSYTNVKYELYPRETYVITRETQKNEPHLLTITRWRNRIQTKRNSISSHHISLITIFPMSQEFCNAGSVWESYANFSEDAQKFLCKNELLLYCCEKNLRPVSTEFTSLPPMLAFWMCLYTH